MKVMSFAGDNVRVIPAGSSGAPVVPLTEEREKGARAHFLSVAADRLESATVFVARTFYNEEATYENKH